MARKEYDKLTDIYFSNPKLVWQHTISGEKHFDSCDFLGALKSLAHIPDWRDAFSGGSELEAFLDRLEAFFHFNGDLSPDENGQQYAYFYPKDRKSTPAKLIKLVTQYLGESAKLAEFNNDKDWAEKLSIMPVEWIEPNNLIRSNPDNDTEAYLGDTWGDTYNYNKKSNWTHLHYCLQEACYGLAADYFLQQYLMQDFYEVNFNLSYQYELRWVHCGCFFFTDGKCYVSTTEGR